MRRHARADGPKLNLDPDIVMGTLFVMILLLGAFVAITLYQQGRISAQQEDIRTAFRRISHNQDRIDHQQTRLAAVERRDRINSYRSAYRFCTRINIDRASLHYYIGQSRDKRELQRLEEREGAPILDCNPNVNGGPARYQGPLEQRRFVRRWRLGQLSDAELGICRIRIDSVADPRVCVN